MKSWVIALPLCLAAQATWAVTPFVLSDAAASEDTDRSRVQSVTLGAGLYTDPDKSLFNRVGYRHAFYRFTAPGFALRGNADLLFASRSWDTSRGELRTEGEVGQIRLDNGRSHAIGFGQVVGRINPQVGYEVRLERHIVDSPASLQSGIVYNALTAAADYEVTPRFVLSGVLGQINFSDDNRRPMARAKATYVISEEHGFSGYVRGRYYRDSNPYTGNYFSPERFGEVLGGVGIRRRVGEIKGTLSAFAEYGRQRIDGSGSPVYGWQVRYESFVHQMWRLELALGAQSTAGTLGGSGYRYRYGRVSLLIPF